MAKKPSPDSIASFVKVQPLSTERRNEISSMVIVKEVHQKTHPTQTTENTAIWEILWIPKVMEEIMERCAHIARGLCESSPGNGTLTVEELVAYALWMEQHRQNKDL